MPRATGESTAVPRTVSPITVTMRSWPRRSMDLRLKTQMFKPEPVCPNGSRPCIASTWRWSPPCGPGTRGGGRCHRGSSRKLQAGIHSPPERIFKCGGREMNFANLRGCEAAFPRRSSPRGRWRHGQQSPPPPRCFWWETGPEAIYWLTGARRGLLRFSGPRAAGEGRAGLAGAPARIAGAAAIPARRHPCLSRRDRPADALAALRAPPGLRPGRRWSGTAVRLARPGARIGMALGIRPDSSGSGLLGPLRQ